MKDLGGLKRKEIEKCCRCGQGVMNNHQLIFYRATIERFVVDLDAVQRQHGLEMMLGGGPGSATIAQIMGPDDDLAKRFTDDVKVIICMRCADKATIAGTAEEEDEKNERRIEAASVPGEATGQCP